jgi:predicted solute-binding protein
VPQPLLGNFSPHERIAAVQDAMSAPVVERLLQLRKSSNEEGPASAGLFFDTAAENTSRLLNDQCGAAFITAIDFAKSNSDFSLHLPAVSSKGASRAILLLMKPGTRTIRTVAFGSVASADVVLTKIILAEKYELEVAFQPASGTIEDRLLKADAVLVSGDDALLLERGGSELDLVDEWSDLTELPFVHLVCAGRKTGHSKNVSSLLHSAAESAAEAVDVAAAHVSSAKKIDVEITRNYLSNFSYIFDDDATASVNEFFRYAFYLGMLPDIPDIRKFADE